MPPWMSEIRSAQRKEFGLDFSRFVQLATIGIDNTPRVRTVVFRGWSESSEMEIYIDKRSQKYYELDLNNNVEICWFFLRSKCQFRLRGTSRVGLVNENIHHWKHLSQESKSMWRWPMPGEAYDYNKNIDLALNDNEDKSNNFILLKINITYVDQLLLHKPIHIRRRWFLKNEWIEERINP